MSDETHARRDSIATRAKLSMDRLLSSGLIRANELQPCYGDDIRALEAAYSITLPASYKLFLSHMGRGAGSFLTNDHWTAYFDALLSLDRNARARLRDVELPTGSFCFATRMGEVYLFIGVNELSDDPPVHCWTEGDESRVTVGFASFWDWFDEMASDFAGR